MKHRSILSLFIFLLGLGVTTTSCEDMLTPDMDRYNTGFSGTDTVNFYFGIIANVQDMVEQNQLLGDLRSDLVATTAYSSDSISDIVSFNRQPNGDNGLLNRAAYYKVINQCNFYLSRVDTLAKKNNVQIMKKEFAQVANIRAWVYLQLVQTYGRVPFFTKPANDTNTGWETNPEAWADADNLVDLLKDDLIAANRIENDPEYGYPNYGDLDTKGDMTINTRYLRFYSDLILGDLYLLRGNGQAGDPASDYVQAASYYFNFLKKRAESGYVVDGTKASINKHEQAGSDVVSYSGSALSWQNLFSRTDEIRGTDYITIIPSTANATYGHKILSNVSQVYGFDAHSTTSTSSGTASVWLSPNLKSRQVQPSESYLQLCAAQNYKNYTTWTQSGDLKWEYYDGAGDARLYGTAPVYRVRDGEGTERFIIKDAPVTGYSQGVASSSNFKLYRGIYRLRQVYLRYAEAINRAGYPRLAFAVLRDGINKNKFPNALLDSVITSSITPPATPEEQGHYKREFYLDSCTYNNAANYIGPNELYRILNAPNAASFLDFKIGQSGGAYWSNSGIHEAGCGTSSKEDSLFSVKKFVIETRLVDELVRTGQLTPEAAAKRAHAILQEGGNTTTDDNNEGTTDNEEGDEEEEIDITDFIDDTKLPTFANLTPEEKENLAAEINAVETIIADECALETAYEGYRMGDLIRFARHKNNDAYLPGNSGDYGTVWLAWKIARRDEKFAPYEQPQSYNSAIYNLMLNPDNWYVRNPEY